MPQQDIALRFGKPELTSITVVGASLDANSIVLSGELSGTVTVAEIGTDNPAQQPRAGYVGNTTIAGLLPYTKYNWTATQNGKTISGYTWTAPRATDDYIVIPITCDNLAIGGKPAGGYTKVRAIAEANPDKGVYFVHIDDHYGYMAANQINELISGLGHKVSGTYAYTLAKVYDYAIGAFAALGLYSASGSDYYCLGGHDEDRIWCYQNIPVLPAAGDWDNGANDMGWMTDPTDTTLDGNGISNKQRFDNARLVWDAFLKPLSGTGIDTGSLAWEHTLGFIKFVAPDTISKASGDASSNITKPSTVMTDAQVDNVIAAMDDDTVPFKFLCLDKGIRYIVDPQTSNASGTQYPLAGNETFATRIDAHPEWARLITDAGGLMSLPSCNGSGSGQFGVLQGDYHALKVALNLNDAGLNDERFVSICTGTINSSPNMNVGGMAVGDIQDGSEILAIDGDTSGSYANLHWWVIAMFAYGSRDLKEIEFEISNDLGTTLLNKKMVESLGGNMLIDKSNDLYFQTSNNDSGAIT